MVKRANSKEGRPVILHNDFKLDNIILEPINLQPKALIDWDLGTRGDAMGFRSIAKLLGTGR